ncbi:MAG: putative GNAT superfamily acetyltransferase [Polyangiales bacterium]
MIRPYSPEDAGKILLLNESSIPAVSVIDAQRLAFFAKEASWFQVLEVDGQVEGFVILLVESTREYMSPNFRWFLKRHERFAYIDRIALSETVRRNGHGRRLYEEAEAWVRANSRALICAEVNTVPPNPASHRFHRATGFREVARTRPYGPDKEVAMYEKYLD